MVDFDLNKKYFVINVFYGGLGLIEYWFIYVLLICLECGCGYLVVKVNNCGIGGRSKMFLSFIYLWLGDVDI